MSIAFPAIFLLLLVLPGILFRYSYRKGIWKSPVVFDSIANELTTGVIFSLVIHVCTYYILTSFRLEYDFSAAFTFLTGYYTEKSFATSTAVLGKNFVLIGVYFIAINTLSYIVGIFFHLAIRRYHLDLKFPFLKFSNEWYYIFYGEQTIIDELNKIPFYKRLLIKRKNINRVLDSVYSCVSVVVTHGSKSYLYWGICYDYSLTKDGKLDRIVLQMARRRNLENDNYGEKQAPENDDERFYEIEGDYITIDYSKVNTLNIDYRYIEEADSSSTKT